MKTTELRDMLALHSFKTAAVPFHLSSGGTSSSYVDVKLCSYKARGATLIATAFLELFKGKRWAPVAVGGLTLGADPLAVAIAHESYAQGLFIDAFTIRKEPKDHGTKRFIEGLEDPAYMSVVILEDVCTTGRSMLKAIRRAREANMDVIGAACLVDREAGGREAVLYEGNVPFAKVFRLSDLEARSKVLTARPSAPQTPFGRISRIGSAPITPRGRVAARHLRENGGAWAADC